MVFKKKKKKDMLHALHTVHYIFTVSGSCFKNIYCTALPIMTHDEMAPISI